MNDFNMKLEKEVRSIMEDFLSNHKENYTTEGWLQFLNACRIAIETEWLDTYLEDRR